MSWPTVYRPRRLDDVVGQDTPVRMLRNILARYEKGGLDPKLIPNSLIIEGPFGSGKCIVGDSLVLTKRGFERIDSFKQSNDGFTEFNLNVLSKDGWATSSHFFQEEVDKTIEVTLWNGMKIRGTFEHPLYVFDHTSFKFEFRKLEDIKEGDWVCAPIGMRVFGEDKDLNFTYAKSDHDHNSYDLTYVPKRLEADLARFLGYFVANGSSYGNYLQMSSTYYGFWKDVNAVLKRYAGLETVAGEENDYASFKDRKVGRRQFKELITHLLDGELSTARFKKVPTCILTGSETSQREFLRGLFDCDSWLEADGFHYCTASEELARTVQLMCYNFGWTPTLAGNYNSEHDHTYWTLSFHSIDMESMVPILWSEDDPSFKYDFSDITSIQNKHKRRSRDVIPGIRQAITASVNRLRNTLRVNAGGWYKWSDGKKYQFDLNWLCQNQHLNPNANYAWLEKAEELLEYGLAEYGHAEFEPLLVTVRELLNSRYFLSPVYIKEVISEPVMVYDFTIPEGHNFYSNGVISHNTTLARIMARYLNCEKGPLDACGECKSCKDIEHDRSRNLLEMDAATNRGIADINNIKETLNYKVQGRFRVIIMDEAHQITKDGWAALLKVLEENTGNNIFIFATTDAHKIIDTIFSRSITLRVSTVTPTIAAPRINYVFNSEGVAVEEGVAETIAMISKGHMRDCMQLSETSTILADGAAISVQHVYEAAGLSTLDSVTSFLNMFFYAQEADFIGFLSSYLEDPMRLLRSARFNLYQQLTNPNANDGIIAHDKILLLEMFVEAGQRISSLGLEFPFMMHFYRQFQEKRRQPVAA